MNAGLSNLVSLKSWLLTASMVAGTDYDAAILAIGKGVAGQMESHCNRKFSRAVGDTHECSADIMHVTLPRYPVEVLSKVEIRDSLIDGWIDQGAVNEVVWNMSEAAGIVSFGIRPSFYRLSRIRFTFTGGYFFEQLEPTDGGYPTAAVAGAAPLPADLLLAWELQCEHLWTQRDKLGLAIAHDVHASNARVVPALAQVDLIPQVEKLLRPFIRFSLTA